MALKVLLDTNFLLIPAQFKVDVFEEIRELVHGEYELVVPKMVLFELMRLAAGRGKHSGAARLALRMVEEKKVRVEEAGGKADDWLLEQGRGGAVVCTNDAGLIKLLRENNVKCIRLRGKSQLGFA